MKKKSKVEQNAVLVTEDRHGTIVERDPKGRLLPGHSLNPGGRFRIDPVVKEMLIAATPKAAKRLIEALDAKVVVHYQGEEVGHYVDHAARMQAALAILDRLHGKPVQATELEAENLRGARMAVVILPPQGDGET